MRLAVVIERYDPLAGGNERSTDEVVRGLVSRGHEVTVLCGSAAADAVSALGGDASDLPVQREETGMRGRAAADDGPELEPEPAVAEGERERGRVGFEVMRRSRSAGVVRLLAFRRWALERLEAGNYDASVSMTMVVPASVVEPRGGTVKETLRRTLASRPAGMGRWSAAVGQRVNLKRQVQLRLEAKTMADTRVKRVIALSGYVERQLAEHYGVTGQRVVRVPNGADVASVSADNKQRRRAEIGAAWGVGPEQTLMLFAAANPRLKGFGTLLEALVRLEGEGLDSAGPAVVLLAGKVTHAMHEAARKRGVRDRLRWVGPTREMRSLHAAADVVVLPTFYDPSSKVVLEALLSGTPAISTMYNGASAYLDSAEGMRGRVIADPADAGALAQAMAELCDAQARSACREAIAAGGEALAVELRMATHVQRLEAVLKAVATP